MHKTQSHYNRSSHTPENQFITYYPKEQKFGLSPKQSIHQRKVIVNKQLNPSLKSLANANEKCTYNLCH